jgi:hypothetical protein
MNARSLSWNRGLALATFAVVGVWVLLGLSNWQFLGHGARTGFPNSATYGQTLLFQGAVQLRAVLGVIVLDLAAAAIGYGLVINPIWGGRSLAPPLWLYVAGIIPGSLLVVPITRLVTLVLPNSSAPKLMLAVILAAAVGALALATRSRPPAQPLARRGLDWKTLGAVGLALAGALAFEVEFDRFHIGGEAILFFINDIFSSTAYGVGAAGHWPLISQHYDEGGFLYPVIYGLMTPGAEVKATVTVLYWIHFAVGRLGAASLTYVALRGLRLDRLSSLATLLFFMAASLSLNPLSSRLLFDSINPLGFALHVSRFVIPVLPLVLVSAAANLDRRPHPAAVAVALVLGVGLSSYAIHVAVVMLWAVGVLALTAIAPAAARTSAPWRAACIAGLAVMGGFTLSYGAHGLPLPLRAAILAGGSALGTAVLAWALFQAARTPAEASPDRAQGRSQALLMGMLLLGYGLGLLLLGNVGVHAVADHLGSLWPWRGIPILDRFPPGIVSPTHGLDDHLVCEHGYFWDQRLLMAHCTSVPIFVRTYGLAPVLMTLFAAWWLRSMPRQTAVADRTLTLVFWGVALSLLALPAAFLLMDFVAGPHVSRFNDFEHWLRSRLIEPWFYGGPLLALALFLREADGRMRRWTQSAMLAAVAVSGLSPFVFPAQIMSNVGYMLSALVRH